MVVATLVKMLITSENPLTIIKNRSRFSKYLKQNIFFKISTKHFHKDIKKTEWNFSNVLRVHKKTHFLNKLKEIFFIEQLCGVV